MHFYFFSFFYEGNLNKKCNFTAELQTNTAEKTIFLQVFF